MKDVLRCGRTFTMRSSDPEERKVEFHIPLDRKRLGVEECTVVCRTLDSEETKQKLADHQMLSMLDSGMATV